MHLIGLMFNTAFVLHEFFALQYCNWFVFQLATKRISLFYTRHHICKFMLTQNYQIRQQIELV